MYSRPGKGILTLQRDMIIPRIGNPELLLRHIDAFVEVQVGRVLTPDDAEVQAELLHKVRVGGHLDFGGAAGVVELLEPGVAVVVGHAFGSGNKIERMTEEKRRRAHIAIRAKLRKSAPMTVKHPETPFPDHRIRFPPPPAGG